MSTLTERPNPCAYCPVEHGGYWFPNLSVEVRDRYKHLAITKKHLCKGVARTGMSCDPRRCEAALAGKTEIPQLMITLRELWEGYYQEAYGSSASQGGGFDDILDELGL